MNKKVILTYIGIIAACFVFAAAGYTAWNILDPEYTCAQCHEIRPTHQLWKESAHSKVACVQCHGTAISNGIHSLKEKMGMLFSHFSKEMKNSDIRLSEENVLDVASRCANCHKAEHAKWLSGAHSTRYANIFEDKVHNRVEKPYWECLRCHGMFYKGNINDLMSLNSDNPDDWKIKDRAQAEHPAIPCLSCHEVHTPKAKLADFKNSYDSQIPAELAPKTSLYVWVEKSHLRTDYLTPIKMYLGDREVRISKDPNHLLCIQCHSPNWKHDVRSSDDRTPTGGHEGMSCLACHDPHSNSAANSCAKCHDTSIEKYKYKKGKCPELAFSK